MILQVGSSEMLWPAAQKKHSSLYCNRWINLCCAITGAKESLQRGKTKKLTLKMQRNSFLFACITSAASTPLTENSSSLCKKKKNRFWPGDFCNLCKHYLSKKYTSRQADPYLISITCVADWEICGGLSPVTSKRNNLKSQMTANCRSQPFLIPPGLGI